MVMGFNESRYNSLPFIFSFKWYEALALNKTLLSAAENSVYLAMVTGIICVILATFFILGIKTLSKIIHARVVEIIEQVYFEIKSYGHEEPKKKLIAGIVLTGGGAQLKHIKQLVEYITGMDTRIGYPNEHIAHDSDDDISSPACATAVGLLMKGLREKDKKQIGEAQEEKSEDEVEDQSNQEEKPKVEKKSIFDKWVDKFKDFLDNAE